MTKHAHDPRCGNCNSWLGESAVTLIYVEHLEKWEADEESPVTVKRPRDLRLCKNCQKVNVFVPKISLTSAGLQR